MATGASAASSGPESDKQQLKSSKGTAAQEPVIIVCPPERHIAVAFPEIFSIAKASMTVGERQRYEEVCKLLESLYSQEFMSLRRSIKNNFLAFSVGAKGQELSTRKGRSLPPKADLDLREERLITDFLQLMAAARFSILTKKEWEQALSEQFMFHLPVDINWDYFDTQLLTRYWASSPERRALRKALPDTADRILIFVRGIGVAHDRGKYFDQKLDLLVDYLVIWPLAQAWGWLKRLATWRKRRDAGTGAAPQAVSGGSRTTSPLPGRFTPGMASPRSRMSSATGAAQGGPGAAPGEPDPSRHRATLYVERRTLPRVLRTAWDVIKNFHKSVDIQEPMYKEVVVLYRTAGQGRSVKRKVPLRARSTTERLKDILGRRNIHVKCFHDIPMADLDVIFPDKKVYIKHLSIISMIVQAVMVFITAIAGLWQAGSLDFKSVWSALSLVAARCGQLYSAMQAERSKTIQNMVNILYDKTNDAQEGVLSMLLEDMAEQQLKEAVLAYTCLYLNIEDQLTLEAVDGLGEAFLEDEFDLKLDFAVEDALPRLVQWGLVRHNTKLDRYQALTVDVAYAALTERWQVAYQALSRPPQMPVLPLTALLPDGDRTPCDDPFGQGDALPTAEATPGGGLADESAAVDDVAPEPAKKVKKSSFFSLKKKKKKA